MKFNNVTDTLRQFCLDRAAAYGEEYERCGGMCFCRYLVMYELHEKLCTLVDREFSDFGAYLAAVKELIPGHLNPTLQKPTPVTEYFIREAEDAFCRYLEHISPDCPAPKIPYLRNLTGEEAEKIAALFREKWDYVPRNYWYPMTGGGIREDRLFLSADYVEPYWSALEKLLGLPEKHLFCLSENNYPGGPACMEMAELIGYGGLENACCDRELSWIIYFSHEQTVTFAGSILPQVRELLAAEREHWNRWK